ncbi:MAG: hypothetical protein A2Z02_00215 [Chloroflexi bacterium RBG_16_48_7]|nr:MAG: hypothetical protein A2Z02_00215 [Chloroflexi bacterium RBG_16_48_7]
MNLIKKCQACGTPNYYTRETCGRCGAFLGGLNVGGSNLNYRNDSHTTKLLFLVIVVVVIIMGAIAIWQWGPKTDTSTAEISNITFDMVSTSGARINWLTSKASSSQVIYGKNALYGMVSPFYPANDPTTGVVGVTQHSVILTGLSQNTWYHFKVKSKTKNGEEAISSNDMTFRTGERLNFAGVE